MNEKFYFFQKLWYFKDLFNSSPDRKQLLDKGYFILHSSPFKTSPLERVFRRVSFGTNGTSRILQSCRIPEGGGKMERKGKEGFKSRFRPRDENNNPLGEETGAIPAVCLSVDKIFVETKEAIARNCSLLPIPFSNRRDHEVRVSRRFVHRVRRLSSDAWKRKKKNGRVG